MEFEAKVSFKISDLPEEFVDDHFKQLAMLCKDTDPVTIDGVSVYSTRDTPSLARKSEYSLAEINMARLVEFSDQNKHFFIVKDGIYGALPLWLRAVDDIDIDSDIELDSDLGFYLLVKSSPHVGNTEIRYKGKNWPIVKPLFELISKIEKAQTCDRCGQLLVYTNGQFVNDPRVTTCQCYCPERKLEVEPASI